MSNSDEITGLRADNERLRIENIQMRFALGYPMPADLERHILPSNPFKCGTCDAANNVRAEVERLRAALESAEAWLERWAVHVGRCEGGLRCTCGLTAIRYDVSAALEEAPQGRISEAAAQPAPSGWRPIETAPKDGTQFLTWDSHYGIRVGRCVVRPDHDDWLSYMDAYKGSSKGGIRATHWMPLPPAPGKEEA